MLKPSSSIWKNLITLIAAEKLPSYKFCRRQFIKSLGLGIGALFAPKFSFGNTFEEQRTVEGSINVPESYTNDYVGFKLRDGWGHLLAEGEAPVGYFKMANIPTDVETYSANKFDVKTMFDKFEITSDKRKTMLIEQFSQDGKVLNQYVEEIFPVSQIVNPRLDEKANLSYVRLTADGVSYQSTKSFSNLGQAKQIRGVFVPTSSMDVNGQSVATNSVPLKSGQADYTGSDYQIELFDPTDNPTLLSKKVDFNLTNNSVNLGDINLEERDEYTFTTVDIQKRKTEDGVLNSLEDMVALTKASNNVNLDVYLDSKDNYLGSIKLGEDFSFRPDSKEGIHKLLIVDETDTYSSKEMEVDFTKGSQDIKCRGDDSEAMFFYPNVKDDLGKQVLEEIWFLGRLNKILPDDENYKYMIPKFKDEALRTKGFFIDKENSDFTHINYETASSSLNSWMNNPKINGVPNFSEVYSKDDAFFTLTFKGISTGKTSFVYRFPDEAAVYLERVDVTMAPNTNLEGFERVFFHELMRGMGHFTNQYTGESNKKYAMYTMGRFDGTGVYTPQDIEYKMLEIIRKMPNGGRIDDNKLSTENLNFPMESEKSGKLNNKIKIEEGYDLKGKYKIVTIEKANSFILN